MPLKHLALGLAIAAAMPAMFATAQAEEGLYVPFFTYRTGPFAGSVQGSGANVLLTAAIPKFAAQAIRKIYAIGWKPTHLLTRISNSVGVVMRPAGTEKAVGIISETFLKETPKEVIDRLRRNETQS